MLLYNEKHTTISITLNSLTQTLQYSSTSLSLVVDSRLVPSSTQYSSNSSSLAFYCRLQIVYKLANTCESMFSDKQQLLGQSKHTTNTKLVNIKNDSSILLRYRMNVLNHLFNLLLIIWSPIPWLPTTTTKTYFREVDGWRNQRLVTFFAVISADTFVFIASFPTTVYIIHCLKEYKDITMFQTK